MRQRMNVLSLTVMLLMMFGLTGSVALGQDYQIKKTVELVVPFNTGGTYDAYCRLIQPYFEKYLEKVSGQDLTVIVTNKAGGSGRIAYTDIYRDKNPNSPRLTLMASPTAILFNIADKKSTFKVDEFNFIGNINNDVHYLLVRDDLTDITTFSDLTAAAQKQPLLFGTSGIGASEMQHGMFLTALLKDHGLDLNFDYVNYNGTGEVKAGFLSKDIELTMGNTINAKSYVESKAARPIAVVARKRTAEFPEVPTLIELGCPEEVVASIEDVLKLSYRFVASPNMDPTLLAYCRQALADSLADPELLKEAAGRTLPINFVDWETDYKNAQAAVKTFEAYADLVNQIYND